MVKMNSAKPGFPDAARELLLRCCSVSGPLADTRALSSLVERGVDWERFLALANRNSVTPMVAARLTAEGVARLPAHVARALALTKMDKPTEAMAELDLAAASGPESLSALKLRAQVLFQLKRYDDAIPELQKAAALAPQDPDIPARLGHLYLEKRAYPDAARELVAAFKLDPKSNDILGEIVAAEYLGKNYEAALKALDLLSQREELPAGTVFIRATCYDKLGQAAAALDAYQKFLKLNKDENNDMYFEATARSRFLVRELEGKKR